jgi:hypothetical protein
MAAGEPTGVQSWCGRALIYALFRPPKPANAAARREKARRAR